MNFIKISFLMINLVAINSVWGVKWDNVLSEQQLSKQLNLDKKDISGVKLSHYELIRAFQDLKKELESEKKENIEFHITVFKNICKKSNANFAQYLKNLNI